jgi:hypothetical protein
VQTDQRSGLFLEPMELLFKLVRLLLALSRNAFFESSQRLRPASVRHWFPREDGACRAPLVQPMENPGECNGESLLPLLRSRFSIG